MIMIGVPGLESLKISEIIVDLDVMKSLLFRLVEI